MKEKIEKVKKHLQKYKVSYSVGAGVIVGVAATILINKKIGDFSENKILINSIKQGIAYKSPATNIVITELERRMHPGFITRCLETGEVTASVRKMAENTGVNLSDLYKHLRGELPDVKGYTFEILGEAQ